MSPLPLHAPHPGVVALLPGDARAAGVTLCGLLGAALSGVVGMALLSPTAPAVEATRPVAAVATVAATAAHLPATSAPPLPDGGLHVGPGRPFLGRAVAPLDEVTVATPVAVPAPLPVDPGVERALARLRAGADQLRAGMRAAPAALGALDHALDQVGLPYVWGATGPSAFDCSGLTLRSYGAVGVTLPRVSRDQHAGGGEPVGVDDLLPGDLVFFATDPWDPGVVHHVGMYAGRGLMVAAPRPGLHVRVEPMPAEAYAGAVRVVPARTVTGPDRKAAARRAETPPTPSVAASTPPVAPGPMALPAQSPSAPAAPVPTGSVSTPDPTPTPTPEPTPTATPTATPTPTPSTGTAEPTPTTTAEVTPTPTPEPSLSPGSRKDG